MFFAPPASDRPSDRPPPSETTGERGRMSAVADLTGTKSGKRREGVVKSKGGEGGLKQWWGQMMIRGPPSRKGKRGRKSQKPAGGGEVRKEGGSAGQKENRELIA